MMKRFLINSFHPASVYSKHAKHDFSQYNAFYPYRFLTKTFNNALKNIVSRSILIHSF